jgi:outer membrane protein TolC
MTSLPLPSLDDAVRDAASHRADVASARARVESAREDRSAASAGRLPTIAVDADVGALGNSASTAQTTYTIAANVRVPIFNGNKTRADIERTESLLHQREAELADVETGVRFDIASALLTVEAAEAAVNVAKSAADLARTALTQAEDRFRAGVASTIEVVQAQESVARASEQYISSLYTHAVAAAGLAKAMGVVEEKFVSMVGG